MFHLEIALLQILVRPVMILVKGMCLPPPHSDAHNWYGEVASLLVPLSENRDGTSPPRRTTMRDVGLPGSVRVFPLD